MSEAAGGARRAGGNGALAAVAGARPGRGNSAASSDMKRVKPSSLEPRSMTSLQPSPPSRSPPRGQLERTEAPSPDRDRGVARRRAASGRAGAGARGTVGIVASGSRDRRCRRRGRPRYSLGSDRSVGGPGADEPDAGTEHTPEHPRRVQRPDAAPAAGTAEVRARLLDLQAAPCRSPSTFVLGSRRQLQLPRPHSAAATTRRAPPTTQPPASSTADWQSGRRPALRAHDGEQPCLHLVPPRKPSSRPGSSTRSTRATPTSAARASKDATPGP